EKNRGAWKFSLPHLWNDEKENGSFFGGSAFEKGAESGNVTEDRDAFVLREFGVFGEDVRFSLADGGVGGESDFFWTLRNGGVGVEIVQLFFGIVSVADFHFRTSGDFDDGGLTGKSEQRNATKHVAAFDFFRRIHQIDLRFEDVN